MAIYTIRWYAKTEHGVMLGTSSIDTSPGNLGSAVTLWMSEHPHQLIKQVTLSKKFHPELP